MTAGPLLHGRDAGRARSWWVVPAILAVVGGAVVALVFAPRLAGHASVPDQVLLVRPTASASSAPGESPQRHRTGGGDRSTPSAPASPAQLVVTPSRPVESEGADDHGGAAEDHSGR